MAQQDATVMVKVYLPQELYYQLFRAARQARPARSVATLAAEILAKWQQGQGRLPGVAEERRMHNDDL
ncbi:MAG: hypothetical protein FJ015_07965 [Chloroflexi bacterium]|nr:hypothetical protein [Chloroflexota bacterium]